MADNQMNNTTTSIQHSELSILCSKGCGFFGTAATMNMCSKCYLDHRMSAAAKSAVEKSLLPLPASPARTTILVGDKDKSKSISISESSSSPSLLVVPRAETEPKPRNRCGSCNKKVGVLGFECRCGTTFCGAHRYPEEHKCTFDFMEVGKKAIAKANPVIKADKINRF